MASNDLLTDVDTADVIHLLGNLLADQGHLLTLGQYDVSIEVDRAHSDRIEVTVWTSTEDGDDYALGTFRIEVEESAR